ncbi:stAR-related lipid transfer protein 5-like isoform X1 [Clavelina lepadiformis]|uniref:stAR-related lipid transfer protein 5-like isoform X1 n=1 Tax=Clavelina lepadiformis TaxID=159417 RepID=UPI004042B420
MMETYSSKVKQLVKEVLNIQRNKTGWTFWKNENAVDIYYKPSSYFNGNMYKFVTEIDGPHDMVYDVMKPPSSPEISMEWDKSIQSYELIKTISTDVFIGRVTTFPAVLGLISAREFLNLYVLKTFSDFSESTQINSKYGKVSWIFAESIALPESPETKDYVRVANYPGGFAIVENKKNPSKSMVETFINCDIGGMLPRSLIEAALPSQQILYIQGVKAEVKKRMNQRK